MMFKNIGLNEIIMSFGCSNTGISTQEETSRNLRVDHILTCVLSRNGGC